ncbi:hypothetical protein E2986_00151 [Frieseomelitta varia]|uniref:Uncharacterized protein n=1 Tax=Frieseomelitta varia TaxID=561572 RepID=A0A833WE08_9HYME|nr:hypothetical protein E2986_00151 [Frieseomelitta varia]
MEGYQNKVKSYNCKQRWNNTTTYIDRLIVFEHHLVVLRLYAAILSIPGDISSGNGGGSDGGSGGGGGGGGGDDGDGYVQQSMNPGLLLSLEPCFVGDRVACSSSDPRKLAEDTFYPWLSFDELLSYEEDVRLRTEDREEDDEKEFEERSVMSSTNKLQILWDHFIHAEPQSYEVYDS